jgi:hypothetical protein
MTFRKNEFWKKKNFEMRNFEKLEVLYWYN